MSATTVYLITGANRGVGLTMVQELAEDPSNIIYATARAPSSAKELHALVEKSNGRVKAVKAEVTSKQDLEKATELIEREQGKVDVVIANAGVLSSFLPVAEVEIDSFREHIEINTVGPLMLYQAVYPLLLKSKTPKFIIISSIAGSLTMAFPLPTNPYNVSKAAANMLIRGINNENAKDGVIAIAVHPGVVKTDMGNAFGKGVGAEEMVASGLTPEESASAVLKVISGATLETAGGKFLSYDGSEIAW